MFILGLIIGLVVGAVVFPSPIQKFWTWAWAKITQKNEE